MYHTGGRSFQEMLSIIFETKIMNKSWLLCLGILVLGFSNCLRAQLSYRVGLSTGLVLSDLSTSRSYGDYDRTIRTGLSVGAIGEVELDDHWSIQVLPRYTQNGDSYRVTDVYGACPDCWIDADLIDHFDYLEIPFEVKARFPLNNIAPFVYAGPSLGVLVSDRTDVEVHAGRPYPAFNSGNKITSLDLRMLLGLGMEYALAQPTSLFIDGEYSHGVIDVRSQKIPGSPLRTFDYKLLLGILYHL